ncbi:zinc finger, CCHC-type containing protein [Tanacetum coccineum]
MAAATMKHLASNFVKLYNFEGVDFRRWHKNMHFLLSSMSVVYVLTTLIPKDGENATDSLEAKYMADDASSKNFIVFCIIDKLPPSWKDFKHNLKHLKEELTLVELGSHLRIEESLRVQDSDMPKGNNVANPNKKAKPTCWKCGKTGHTKRDCKGVNVGNKAIGSGIKGSVDGSSNSLKESLDQVSRIQMEPEDNWVEEVTEEVEDDPKTFDEAMKYQDVALWKEPINDDMDSIMGNNT